MESRERRLLYAVDANVGVLYRSHFGDDHGHHRRIENPQVCAQGVAVLVLSADGDLHYVVVAAVAASGR